MTIGIELCRMGGSPMNYWWGPWLIFASVWARRAWVDWHNPDEDRWVVGTVAAIGVALLSVGALVIWWLT